LKAVGSQQIEIASSVFTRATKESNKGSKLYQLLMKHKNSKEETHKPKVGSHLLALLMKHKNIASKDVQILQETPKKGSKLLALMKKHKEE
jgi:hypothetical protein